MNNKKVITNFIWKFLERGGAQLVSFVVSIILARLLAPEVYGTIALVTVFTTIMQVFINSGLGTALVQKKDSDDVDFSTVFYFNMIMCLALYAIMFFTAPLISSFYEMPELTPVIRVLSLTLIISGLKNIQQSYVSKHLLFKKFFFSTLGGTMVSAAVGIYLAYMGYGVWALVWQNVTNELIGTIVLWFTVRWRPKNVFSFQRMESLFSFGWKLLLSALIDTLYNDIRTLIIGKKYSSEDLAFYNKGRQFPNLIVTNINYSIDSVLLPVLAQEQDDKARVKAMTRRAIKTSTYIMMPMMMGLAMCAEPLISLLLTEKWLPCVLYMRVFCFTYAFYPIHTANLNAIKAMGRSDLFLVLEIIKKAIGLTAVLISMWFGVEWMAYSLLITTLISQIINSYPNKKLLNYSYLQQVRDMLPQILLSCVMGAAVFCVQFLGLNDILTLLIQVPLGIAIYVGGSVIFKLESFEYILNIVIGFFKKKMPSKSES
ncbi:MAG: lipopolysaccharide biosynthesis protein [Ruminococcaceae bacterium]|nr:lipopolysaccharide biosynthesis protein [Oscillospiraceae bacterium]